MNRIHCSVLAVAVAGGLCGGIGVAYAGWMGGSANSQAVRRLDEQHHKYMHMHHALEKLTAARAELEQSEDVFKGHKEEAIAHVDAAIGEVKDGLHEQNDDSADPADLPAPRRLDDYPHVRGARDALREARDELKNADPIFQGHRDKALEHVNKAIKQLDEALHEDEK